MAQGVGQGIGDRQGKEVETRRGVREEVREERRRGVRDDDKVHR